MRTKRRANVDSDHFLVIVKIRTKIIYRNKKMEELRNIIWNSEKLREEETKRILNCLWENLKNGIFQSAEKILREKPNVTRQTFFSCKTRRHTKDYKKIKNIKKLQRRRDDTSEKHRNQQKRLGWAECLGNSINKSKTRRRNATHNVHV